MYLKKLELHGFKSFPDKTVLNFNPGSTIIVGPNGSGKSNITDAMRWVLGELSSKNLRGSKMEDVIFSGSDGVRPMGFAEVSVTFDNSGVEKTINSEYDEITVTRRYYRAGDSAYFINKKPVRLKDIVELFMNTGIGKEGYSIVGQGRIAEIISKKSEDRRVVFEESAGITKYRYRKNESQKKLSETEANMVRISDIKGELESRIGPLEREAGKARRYLELYDVKKNLDLSLWKYDMDKIKANIDKTEAETKMSAHELEMAEDTMKQLEEQIDRLYESSRVNKETAQRLRDELNTARNLRSRLDNDVRLIENNTLHARTKLENEQRLAAAADTEIAETEAKKTELRETLKKLNEELAAAADECTRLSGERMNAVNERNSRDGEVEALFRERQKKESELSDIKIRLNVLKNTISDRSERNEGVGEELRGYEEELSGLLKQIESVSSSVNDYESRIGDAVSEFEKADKALSDAVTRQEELRAERAELSARSEALSSRIAAMERMLEHFEGFSGSVKFIMQKSSEGRLSGIHGPLSSLIKTDSRYAVALETSLGQALQNIVTSDEKSAKDAIAFLKNNNAGRATFYPITTVKAQKRNDEINSASSCKGFIGFADDLIECDGKYKEIVSSIVGRICIFDNIDNASDMARARGWRVRAVTLDGQQINAGGSFTGGSARRDSGMLTRTAQIDSMKAEKKTADADLAAAEKELSEIDASYSSLSLKRADADEKRRLMESLASVEKSSLGELEAKKKLTEDLIGKLKGDEADFESTKERTARDIERLEKDAERVEAELNEIIEKREAVAGERGEYDALADELTVSLSNAQIRLTELNKDRENAESSIIECDGRIEALNAEKAERLAEAERLTGEISGASGRSDELLRAGDEKDREITALEEKLASADAESDRMDEELNVLRHKEKDQSAKKELIFINHTKNENKLENMRGEVDKMTSRIWDEYEITYSGVIELSESDGFENVTDENKASARTRLTELKGQLKALGHVNLSAVEEYTETKERYDYIKTQMDDLEKSKRELEKIIEDIESDMRTMFTDAFEKINKNFGEVFRELFGGGHAELTLTDPEDVLTSGIEISAAPPGKTIKHLSLLSGGEQAFIAIALMFALIKFNPSPFCIFDEIEAALDEVNVSRVANYVKRYSQEMQIIMITHRRGTMDIADTLYGVTMPKSGISKVFTLDVSQAEQNEKYIKN